VCYFLLCCRRQGCLKENKIYQTYLHSKVDIDMSLKEVKQQSIKQQLEKHINIFSFYWNLYLS